MVEIGAQFPALISEISAIIGRHRIVVLSAVTVVWWRFPITGKNTGGLLREPILVRFSARESPYLWAKKPNCCRSAPKK
jgi:hypothetical protein